MSNLKSFLSKCTSIALAAVMTVGLSVGVMAKTFDDVDIKHEYKEQIDILSDIGVIVGTSETEFSPDENVTREQMAMLLFRTMLGRDNAGGVNTTDFTDLYDDTYNGVISWANASGYIIGTSATTFEPTGGITLQDAMTMIIRALGQSTTTMDRGYPWTYIDAAIKLGLDKGLGNVNYEATLTRSQTAAILYNALTSEYLIQKTTSNGSTYVEKTTIIEYVFSYDIIEGVVSATNTYSINDYSLVIKDGYVTVAYDTDKAMTVKFDELGLDGKANDWLGKTVKVIYKTNNDTNTINVLGSTYKGTSKNFDTVTVADNSTYISIDGVKYNVVEKLSGSLATNDNELLVYVYDSTGKLVQVKTNAALNDYLGFYNIEMIYDIMDSTVANRAILKTYKFDKLTYSSDKINIAGDLKADELTGGFDNEVKAVNGDYVLYYYNAGNKHLEVAEVLVPTQSILVSKLSSNLATIGGKEYKLGSKAAGVNPDDIAELVTVGKYISIVEKNGVVLAINAAPVSTTSSTYLVAQTDSYRQLINGKTYYVFSAIVEGVKKDIITETADIKAGDICRYIEDSNNTYVVYKADSTYFVQSSEVAKSYTSDADVTLSKGSLPYYSYKDLSFVTDANTVIVAKNGSSYEYKKGAYSSTIDIKDDATVTIVYQNNTGNVKTLLFMYVSDGSLGIVDETAQSVKILAKTGTLLDSGVVYTSYKVYNYNTGTVVSDVLSLNSSLTVGNTYALDSNGNIVNVLSTVVNGMLTGNTSSTITVAGATYKLANDAKIVKLNSDNTVTEVDLTKYINYNVSFVVNGGEVKSVIVDVDFKVDFEIAFDADNNVLAIYTNDGDKAFEDAAIVMKKITRDEVEVNKDQWPVVKGEYEGKNAIVINLYYIEAGEYKFNFTYNSADFELTIKLPEIAPEAEENEEDENVDDNEVDEEDNTENENVDDTDDNNVDNNENEEENENVDDNNTDDADENNDVDNNETAE